MDEARSRSIFSIPFLGKISQPVGLGAFGMSGQLCKNPGVLPFFEFGTVSAKSLACSGNNPQITQVTYSDRRPNHDQHTEQLRPKLCCSRFLNHHFNNAVRLRHHPGKPRSIRIILQSSNNPIQRNFKMTIAQNNLFAAALSIVVSTALFAYAIVPASPLAFA